MKKIAIIDFGGQYTHLISRRIRELGVYSEIYQPDFFHLDNSIGGIIFSGGPQSVDKEDAYRIDLNLDNLPIPLLGICYGHQLIAYMKSGKILTGESSEYGFTKIIVDNTSELFSGLEKEQIVWMSHTDFVQSLPNDFKVISYSDNLPVIAYQHKNKPIFGVQFHPEVTHTQAGNKIIDNFINICGLERDWTTKYFENDIINKIKKQAQNKKILILLSGGVDSLVAFELCIRAVGKDNVFAIHVDTGFMRKNESKEVISHLRKIGYKNLQLVQAEELFLKNLKNITEPEKKREIVGKLFVDIIHNVISRLKDKENWLLMQGTIYPDTIESGNTKNSDKIKTHHNRVKEIEEMIKEGKVIEPLKDLYKDEVRKLGLSLGLSKKLVNRQPFPGPGLVIRILCSNGKIEDNFNEEEYKLNNLIADKDLSGKILPLKSVGVQGDFRTYSHPALIWFNDNNNLDWNVLRKASINILNKLKTVNRVIFSIEKPAELHLKKLYLTKENIKILQDVDYYVRNQTENEKDIWQMPVVELPLFDMKKQYFLIRPVESVDAMTADFYKMSFEKITQINTELKQKFEIGGIFYDITTKPPGTIEWE